MEDMISFTPSGSSVADLNNALRRRTIYIIGEITEFTINNNIYLLDRIMHMDERLGTKEPIHLRIRSGGGSGLDGFALVSKILDMRSQGYEIVADVEGYSMSMAVYITVVCSYRTCGKYDKFMIHNISTGTEGTINAIVNRVEEITSMQKMADSVITDYTDIKQKTLSSKKHTDWYITSYEALELGLIDQIKGVIL